MNCFAQSKIMYNLVNLAINAIQQIKRAPEDYAIESVYLCNPCRAKSDSHPRSGTGNEVIKNIKRREKKLD